MLILQGFEGWDKIGAWKKLPDTGALPGKISRGG
jgi:hypothetical protein